MSTGPWEGEAETTVLHYRILAKLGEGGMGAVYKAQDTKLLRLVAIKRLPTSTISDENARRRLLDEARAASALNHKCIVTVYAIEEASGVDFIVMELVDGETLDALVSRGRLDLATVAAVGSDVADALDCAHTAGLVHRDIKPANVVVTTRGPAKVLDFGIAKPASGLAKREGAPLTDAGVLVGTVAYMSPEQARGAPLDGRSDIFALGTMLYEAATGRRPFEAASPLATLHEIASHTPMPPSALVPTLPAAFDAIVMRALEKAPARRFRTASEMSAALRAISHSSRDVIAVAATEYVARSASAPQPQRSIAVLPLVDLTATHDRQHVCEGISEGIMTALGRVRGLAVVARSSAFRAGGLDAREIGAQLGVTTVVEGTLREVPAGARVTARLIDATTGYQTWSRTFERPLNELMTMEDEIAAAVASTMELAMPSSARHPARAMDPVAVDLYLQGRYLWNRRPGEVVWQAMTCFEKAAAADPDFAEAWAGMADIYATLGSWESGVLPHADALRKARDYASRALALKPKLVEAHTTLAYTILHYDWDLLRAEKAFQRALDFQPSYAAAHHWSSHCHAAAGRFEASLVESQLALAADPMNLLLKVHLAWHWHMARAPERVVEHAARVVKLDARFHWGHYFAGWGAEGVGDFESAVVAMREAVRCSDDDPVMRVGLARAYASAGDRRAASAIVVDLQRSGGDNGLYAYELGLVHLALGENDLALDALERAFRHRSGWMAYLDVDPRLDSLRGDSRFVAVADARRGPPPSAG